MRYYSEFLGHNFVFDLRTLNPKKPKKTKNLKPKKLKKTF